ncbi:hypothetical protein [Streptomyces sp. NBC_00687]|uniref:hypothetical protein n=1 Tax=Streptomyces sp. NBC_00687 TaxID=2975807 RepID=UPI00224F285A|nr:hypothetical protein [Streptomyces sp. NBC_00687]MCX4918892.1 hypothetical protein [Streptomyces sp. NBC_00687]
MRTPADYLALARAEEDSDALQNLARCPYPFGWQALASNPHTPPAALRELTTARDSVWNDNRLLRLLAEHPGADLRVLRAVLDAVATKLAEGERPYAAVLALADRLELEADELRKLGTFQGASARLRHLLDLRLSTRIRQTPPTA